MGIGIWAPAAYMLFLGGSLYTFSAIYRKRACTCLLSPCVLTPS